MRLRRFELIGRGQENAGDSIVRRAIAVEPRKEASAFGSLPSARMAKPRL